MKFIFAIFIGYLLGSISPAYFLCKLIKGTDIRKEGDGNAGTRNVYRVLGLIPAVITGIIDLSKGVLAIYLTSFFVPVFFSYLSGVAAVFGHIFPFYLNFKAGQGGATASGILIYFLITMIKNSWISWQAILILLISGIILIYITKLGPVAGLVTLPFLIIFILFESPLNLTTGFTILLLIFALIQLFRCLSKRWQNWFFIKEIPIEKKRDLLHWRTLLRPLAILILIFYILFGKKIILIILGIVSLISILLDLSRLSSEKFNLLLLKNLIIKEKEKKVFSSITFFLLACFISLLIFEKNIAFLTIIFLIFGDLASKYFGVLFGRKKFFRKTLEGCLGHLASCLLFGFLLSYFLPLPILTILVGSTVASFVESIPMGIDDNFTVSIISGSIMHLLKLI